MQHYTCLTGNTHTCQTLSKMDASMDELLKIRVYDVNEHIVCSLCGGYFIDATTTTECLHTFCKSCIVKYLQTSKSCPQCGNKVHESQPLIHLRADRTMQDIVYKLVPNLFENEEKRREDFYKSRGFAKQKKGIVVEKKAAPKLSCILNNPNAHQYKYDEQIGLCLERYSIQSIQVSGEMFDLKVLERKFIRCSIRVLIAHLKRIITKKLNIPNGVEVEMMCDNDELSDEMSMKQVNLVYWSPRGSPMILYYRLREPG
ncbi:polycomb group RING finger protein 1-like [Pecten maximus]|uniref:polycomb group RING finger protein 1-like n=1 Tax=Pecten maximus TaxID=6579 RepID=UPI001458EF7A|nr:polycomb group RING finger protein 1-like [Pecten maximus]